MGCGWVAWRGLPLSRSQSSRRFPSSVQKHRSWIAKAMDAEVLRLLAKTRDLHGKAALAVAPPPASKPAAAAPLARLVQRAKEASLLHSWRI